MSFRETRAPIQFVGWYLDLLASTPYPSREENVRLGEERDRCRKEGDEQGERYYINQIVEANLRLVWWVAKVYDFPADQVPDVIQELNLVLMHCAEHWELSRGPFVTYASYSLKCSARGLASDVDVHTILPRAARLQLKKLRSFEYAFEISEGRRPSDHEVYSGLCQELGGIKVVRAIRSASTLIYLDAKCRPTSCAKQEGGLLIEEGDSVPGTADVLIGDTNETVERAFQIKRLRGEVLPVLKAMFDERDARIICRRFNINGEHDDEMTLVELGELVGVVRARIHQIEIQALERLRVRYRANDGFVQKKVPLREKTESAVIIYTPAFWRRWYDYQRERHTRDQELLGYQVNTFTGLVTNPSLEEFIRHASQAWEETDEYQYIMSVRPDSSPPPEEVKQVAPVVSFTRAVWRRLCQVRQSVHQKRRTTRWEDSAEYRYLLSIRPG